MKKKSLEIFMRDLVVLDIGYLEVSSVPQNIKYELMFYIVLRCSLCANLECSFCSTCKYL